MNKILKYTEHISRKVISLSSARLWQGLFLAFSRVIILLHWGNNNRRKLKGVNI